MSMSMTGTTKYTGVAMTRAHKRPFEDVHEFARTRAGNSILKRCGECMNAGGTVSARTYYKDGIEYMDAELVWPDGR